MVNYAWMLALAAAWQQHADDEPRGSQMARVDAQAGQLHAPTGNAANDLAALLLVLVVVRWWTCAKWLALSLVFQSNALKTVANSRAGFFNPLALPSRAIPGLPAFSHPTAGAAWLCQIDHLPIS